MFVLTRISLYSTKFDQFYRFIGGGKIFFRFFLSLHRWQKFWRTKLYRFIRFFPQKLCICIALNDTFLSIAAHHWCHPTRASQASQGQTGRRQVGTVLQSWRPCHPTRASQASQGQTGRRQVGTVLHSWRIPPPYQSISSLPRTNRTPSGRYYSILYYTAGESAILQPPNW